MNYYNKLRSVFFAASAIVILFFLASCKKKNTSSNEPDPAESFDKQALLINLADNVILPNYVNFKKSLDSLVISYSAFKNTPDLTNFQTVKLRLHTAYLNYQSISINGFGPGEDQYIRSNFNVFPSNITLINSNIISGTYDLAATANLASKGFPALDYLFYGKDQTEADQLQLFVSDAKRKKYVDDLLTEMTVKTNAVIDSWQSSYRNTFVNSLGTDLGSSIGFLVNQINFELDYLKNYKFAIPLGLKSGGVIMPDNCEAYYGGQSIQYALATLKAIEDLYLGRSSAGFDGKGFDDYLVHLKTMHVNGSLNDAINTQFSVARTKIQGIANPLSQKVVSNNAQVKVAHDELLKLLVLLKTDMPSSLGVVITYQDGDGD